MPPWRLAAMLRSRRAPSMSAWSWPRLRRRARPSEGRLGWLDRAMAKPPPHIDQRLAAKVELLMPARPASRGPRRRQRDCWRARPMTSMPWCCRPPALASNDTAALAGGRCRQWGIATTRGGWWPACSSTPVTIRPRPTCSTRPSKASPAPSRSVPQVETDLRLGRLDAAEQRAARSPRTGRTTRRRRACWARSAWSRVMPPRA